MKKIIVAIIVLGCIGGLIVGYLLKSKERAGEAENEKPVAAESRISRNAEGETTVSIDKETQQRLALKTEALATAQLPPEVKGYGRVLDPAALSSTLSDLVSARAAAEVSGKELTRLKTLSAQDNASVRALEAAQAAADRDSAQVESMQARFVAAWGQPLANRPDLPKLIQSIASGESALVRIDLPAGNLLRTNPVGARLVALADENNPVESESLGSAPTVDAQTQGQGFLFLTKSRQPALVPGAAVIGYVETPGDVQVGVFIPSSAVVRFNGRTWIYLMASDQNFTRREISEDIPLADGWFLKERFKSGDMVVVSGAQILLSEEQKNQIRMGD